MVNLKSDELDRLDNMDGMDCSPDRAKPITPEAKTSSNAQPQEETESELHDEMLYKATHPNKIGIYSSGGLSNTILKNIQEKYSDLIPHSSFEISFETFDQILMVPQPIDDTSNEELTVDESAEQSGMDAEANLVKSEATQPGDEIEIEDSKAEDDEYVFEPDVEPEPGLEGMYEETGEAPVDFRGRAESEEPIEPEPEKPLTFRERAHRIFIELKRKLGLIKPERQETPEPIRQPEIMETRELHELEEPQELQELEESQDLKASKELQESQELPVPEKSLEIQKRPESDKEIQKEPTPGLKETAVRDLSQHDFPRSSEKSLKSTAPSEIKEVDRKPVEILMENDILFIITCLDDENEIENTFLILELAKKLDLLTIVIASLPRYFGKVDNVHTTNKLLQRMRLKAELVILLPYFETIEFKLIPNLIHEILEMVTEPGLINVDVADLKIIVKGGNVGVITFGAGRHATRAKDAFFGALDSKLLNVELPGVQKVMLNVTGSRDMTLGEVEGIAEQIKRRIKPNARLILGARINPDMKDSIKLFLLFGVSPMQVLVNRYANE
jgi:hypothetical protein